MSRGVRSGSASKKGSGAGSRSGTRSKSGGGGQRSGGAGRPDRGQRQRNDLFDAATPVEIDPVLPSTDVRARSHALHLRCRGGMGEIWNAVDVNLRRRMVKKVLRPEKRALEENVIRLIAEAQITAQLDHPNIPPVHDLGIDPDGNVYLTMHRIRGRTLAHILAESDVAKRGIKELRRHLRIFLSVCDAVAFAHSRGVINRDLKADNVMVGDFGEVYVLDWGLAKLLPPADRGTDGEMPRLRGSRGALPKEEGFLVGTPRYLSPEQANADLRAQDERTDVFGLGTLLYEILAGRAPYAGSTKDKVLNAQRCAFAPLSEVAPATVPPALCKVVERAMSKERKDRHQTVAELRAEVEHIVEEGWMFPERSYPTGTIIMHEGAAPNAACVITDGACRAFRMVRGQKKPVGREMGIGDCFGEVALFSGRPRTASVEAVTDVRLLVVPAEHFADMGNWLSRFVRGLADRFRDMDDRILELERALAEAKKRAR